MHAARELDEPGGAEARLKPAGFAESLGYGRGDACGGERAANPLHCPGIDSELFGNDAHRGLADRFSSGNHAARTVRNR